MRLARPIRIAVLLATLGALALPASAGAYIYWGNTEANQLGRASLDGSRVDRGFIRTRPLPTALGGAGPIGVAVDGKHIYWTNVLHNGKSASIGRANLDGSDVDQRFINAGGRSLALDGAHIYFVSGAGIGRANLDGTHVDRRFISGVFGPCGLAVDRGHVYWSSTSQEIGRASLNGTHVDPLFIEDVDTCSLAVGPGHLYWSNGPIGRANLDGTHVDRSFIDQGGCGIARYRGHLYWARAGGVHSAAIVRADLDGTDVRQIIGGRHLVPPGSPYVGICGIAVD